MKMAPSRRRINGLLARVNFPLYTVQMLSSRHVLVGGGGGSSNTGVGNGFEIYEISHNGEKFVAEEVVRHETGPNAVMNCSSYTNKKHSFVVAGQESYCQLYNVQSILVEDEHVENIGAGDNIRQRNIKNKAKNSKKLKFVIQPSDCVKTDFDGEEPLVRVIRISSNGNVMVTGGTDSKVKLWKFPSMQLLCTLDGHRKEIDDLDFSRRGNFLISVAKDGAAILWDYTTGKELRRLEWQKPEQSKYLYKRCRFGVIEGEKDKNALYLLVNPVGSAKNQKSYLQRWFPHTGTLGKVTSIDESLSALAVRDDGRFVAVGTMFSGSIFIYVAFSLGCVLHVPGAHMMFVTGLEFLPVTSDQHAVTSSSETAVVSISVDNQVCIHSLPYRRTIPLWVAIVFIIVTLFCTFLFCSYIGL